MGPFPIYTNRIQFTQRSPVNQLNVDWLIEKFLKFLYEAKSGFILNQGVFSQLFPEGINRLPDLEAAINFLNSVWNNSDVEGFIFC